MPGYQRAAWRSVLLTIVLGTSWGLLFHQENTLTTLRVAFFVALPIVAGAGYSYGSAWTLRKKIVTLGKSLAQKAGHSPDVNPHTWIEVPKKYKTDPEAEISLTMGEKFNSPEHSRETMAKQTARKLGLKEYEHKWEDEGRSRLLVKSKPEPRVLVMFEEIREILESLSDDELFMGLGSRDKPIKISLNLDSPHILCSMGSGGGKSAFCKSLALQTLYKGGRVVIIDIIKRGASHKWAKNIPGVEIYRTPESAHDAILKVDEECRRRAESYWHYGEDHVPDDQRILLVVEEQNSSLVELNAFWRVELEQRGTSPAVASLRHITNIGRESRTNVVSVGQRMSANASGGGDTRENYGVRIGNRYSKQTANILFADVDPRPKSASRPGRIQVVIGQTAELVQVPKIDGEQPVKWALTGTPQPEVVFSGSRGLASQSGVSPDHAGTVRQLHLVSESDDDVAADAPVGLREAVNLGIVQCDLIALRNGARRDREFPRAVGRRGSGSTAERTYNPRELVEWDRNRVRRESGGGA